MKSLKLAIALALFAAGLTGAHAQSWLTNNLVAWYQFNGDTSDSSGNGYDGYFNGYFATNRFGTVGKSIAFDGSGNDVFQAYNLPLLNQNFTYSVWVKISGQNHNNDIQSFGVLGPAPQHTWNYTYNVSSRYWNLWDDQNNTWNSSATASNPTANWVHVVITYDATNYEHIYTNGVLANSRAVTEPINDAGGRTFLIGTCDGAGGQVMNGLVDDVRLYNVALTAGQVSQLYVIESHSTPAATATAVLDYGFVVHANLLFGGIGYTSTPSVQFIGGGGSGAQAVAVVSNGVVTAINVLNAGYGYTNTPLVVVAPPYYPVPNLAITPASGLAFTGLAIGTNYQVQQLVSGSWTNQASPFTATNSTFVQPVTGSVTAAGYRLAPSPIPATATANPVTVSGFIVGATLTAGGSGYVTNPAVTITGGGGANASASAKISAAGVVTNITILNAGGGYTGTPVISIAAPPFTTYSPAVIPMVQLATSGLVPYGNYQIQNVAAFGTAWTNSPGGAFSPAAATNSLFFPITGQAAYYRLQVH